MKNEDIYIRPKARLLHATPLAIADVAGRSAYDSFDKAEHDLIKSFPLTGALPYDIPSSKLLNQLAWVSFHHSVLEHVTLNFHLTNLGRGVLQELARHRIASYTVKSTRYTMTPILCMFAISQIEKYGSKYFVFEKMMKQLNFSIIKNQTLLGDEIHGIYVKLEFYVKQMKYNQASKYLSGAQNDILEAHDVFDDEDPMEILNAMLEAKGKRNAGDDFKGIVTDNFRTELVWSINLRSLKNFLDLRHSGAAWFQIQWLAEEVLAQIPTKYRELIWKKDI